MVVKGTLFLVFTPLMKAFAWSEEFIVRYVRTAGVIWAIMGCLLVERYFR